MSAWTLAQQGNSRRASRAFLEHGIIMKTAPAGKLRDGARCKVIGGVHAGKSGVVRDINTSRTGHVTITVVQPDSQRFKTLARNVAVQPKRR